MKLSVVPTPKRTSDRFKAKERALVWCHLDSEDLPYHLIDISYEGFSFKYLGSELKYDAINQVSLYYENELIVENLPVEVVSDFLLADNLVPVRRASVFIKSLSTVQDRDLQYFIRNFTEGEL